MADPEMVPVPFPDDSLVTVRWDADEGRPVYDLGGLDEWSAATMLMAVVRRIEEGLPAPRAIDEDD